MGQSHSETSCVLYDLSGQPGLDGFDPEAERSAGPLEVRTAAAGSLWSAPEEKLRAFSVVEQYEPSAPADIDRFESAQPSAVRWSGARAAGLAGVAVLVAFLTGLGVGTQLLPEPRAIYPSVQLVSTAEAPPAPPVAAIVPTSTPIRYLDRTVGRQSASARASNLPAGTALELDAARRALASLEDQGVPLENCVTRVPAVDRVVVRCHGESSDEWTLDFNRALDRWQVVGSTR